MEDVTARSADDDQPPVYLTVGGVIGFLDPALPVRCPECDTERGLTMATAGDGAWVVCPNGHEFEHWMVRPDRVREAWRQYTARPDPDDPGTLNVVPPRPPVDEDVGWYQAEGLTG